jgi:hypothetical protein
MKLTAYELAYVRSRGLIITEKCDACRQLLNQSARAPLKANGHQSHWPAWSRTGAGESPAAEHSVT